MLTAGREICHVDRCPHGCSRDTGCQGIEWRKNHAEQALRARIKELQEDAARWGFVVLASCESAESSGSISAIGRDASKENGNGI